MAWEIGAEGRRRAEELLHGHLANIELDGLWFPLPETAAEEVTSTSRDVHAAVLTDLYALVEEMRFEIALGSMIMADFDAAAAAGAATTNELDASNPLAQLGMLIEHLPVLRHYGAPMPSPADLFDEPYEHMAGHRVLGTWFAAQLFDSAWYRGIRLLGCLLEREDRQLERPRQREVWQVLLTSRTERFDESERAFHFFKASKGEAEVFLLQLRASGGLYRFHFELFVQVGRRADHIRLPHKGMLTLASPREGEFWMRYSGGDKWEKAEWREGLI